MAIAWYERIQLAQTLKYNKLHDPKTGKFATQATGSSAGSKRKKGGKVGRPEGSGSGVSSIPSSRSPKPKVLPMDTRTSTLMAKFPLARFVNTRDPARNDALKAKLSTLANGTVISGWTKIEKDGQSYWKSGKQISTTIPDSVLNKTIHQSIIVKALKDGVLPPMQALALHSKDYPQIANWPIMQRLLNLSSKEKTLLPSMSSIVDGNNSFYLDDSTYENIKGIVAHNLQNGVKHWFSERSEIKKNDELNSGITYKAFAPKKRKLKKYLESIDGKAMPVEQKKFSVQKKQPAAMVLAQNAGWTRLGGFENPKWINTREPDASKRAEVMDFLPAAVLISKIYKPKNTSVGKVKRKNVFGPQVIQNAHPLENTSPFYYNKRGSNRTISKTKRRKKEMGGGTVSVAESVKSRKPRDYRKEYDNFHSKPEQVKMRGLRNIARRQSGLSVGDPREVDHIVPLSKGGSHKKSNLRIVSRHTNRSKMAKTTKEYIAFIINRCFRSRGLKI